MIGSYWHNGEHATLVVDNLINGRFNAIKDSFGTAIRSFDHAGYKSRDVHEWQESKGESQQANPQNRPPQYFSENLSHTEIEQALQEDFSLHHIKPYQLVYTPGGMDSFGRLHDRAKDVIKATKLLSETLKLKANLNNLRTIRDQKYENE
ncbi:Uncharacterized protein Fot_36256 [Forsythia ovata]|uniref:Uncharacterized protein n=1 Tax=Forsythia ovata TaxID=205694 RepID=A0ABD1SPZ3_9LAMI